MRDRPQPRPKPGPAKPTFWLLAWLGILESPSRLKPGQSRGFQDKPELAHHYPVDVYALRGSVYILQHLDTLHSHLLCGSVVRDTT